MTVRGSLQRYLGPINPLITVPLVIGVAATALRFLDTTGHFRVWDVRRPLVVGGQVLLDAGEAVLPCGHVIEVVASHPRKRPPPRGQQLPMAATTRPSSSPA